jgi:hypothetical protein
MDESVAMEHEKHQVAIQVSVLSYDLNRLNPVVPTLLAENTLDMLVAKRDELIQAIDEQVALDGFYEVPDHMDAKWLAGLLQTELGSYVDAGEYNGVKAIVPVEPGTV